MPRPYEDKTFPFGRGSLDLRHPIGEVEPQDYSILRNAFRRQDGLLTGRPGLDSIFTGMGTQGTIVSIFRLNDTLGTFGTDPLGRTPAGIRLFSSEEGNLYYASGSVARLIDQGYSGLPLSIIPYRPPLAARPWAYIADSARMRKVAPTSATAVLDLPLGLPAPGNPDARMPMDEFPPELYFGGWTGTLSLRNLANLTLIGFEAVEGASPLLVEAVPASKTTIDQCESAAPWTVNAGTGGVPTLVVDPADFKEGSNSLHITTVVGGAGGAYYNFVSRALSLNLTRVGDQPATDEDHIHVWLQTDLPDKLTEIRIYFILDNFSATLLPGASAGNNTNFYVKAIKPADFSTFIAGTGGALTAQGTANTNTQTQQAGGGTNSTAGVPSLAGGQKAWTEFGSAKYPLRRGDFTRFGADESLDWSDVVGMSILVFTNTNTVVQVWFDDIKLSGGAGPDSSIAGNSPYNWRVRNYDPRTGVKGNPSPTSLEEFWLDLVRQEAIVKPDPYGDPEIRQQAFRRGGALTRGWYKVGENGSDGGEIRDRRSDNSLFNEELLEEDNDQPVTTVDENNRTILAQPLHSIWGPVDDVIFGCGDPYRKGEIYWCKKGDADAWPSYQHKELCGSAEELMGGYVWGGQPFAFSRERGFVLYPNFGGSNDLGYAPTACVRGPVSRTAFAVGLEGAYFCARDGFYVTAGGAAQSLSASRIDPLFDPDADPDTAINGFHPIDFTFPDEIRVTCHGFDIWLAYKNTKGIHQVLIWNVSLQYWRVYQFPALKATGQIYSEPAQPLSLLIGGSGKVFAHQGTDDDGLAIAGRYQSGAQSLGVDRNEKQLGDIWLDVDRKGGTLTILTLVDEGQVSLPALSISTGSGLEHHVLDPFESTSSFGKKPRQSHTLSLDVSWSTLDAPPILRDWGASFIVEPEVTKGRPTDWDNQGRLTDKMVKGILIEADTGGVSKELRIEADGALATTITINHDGRVSKHYAWAEFEGRVLRINPDDTVGWQLFDYRWIFDEEPAQLTRWETQLLDDGIPGWRSIPFGFISYRTAAGSTDVTLQVELYDQKAQLLSTIVPTPLLTASTTKRKIYIGFPAHKAAFMKWIFTCSTGFWLYKEESKIFVQPWDGSNARWISPWGNDDLDGVRGLRDAGLGAERAGGGGD